jgi:hypothetical protein
MTRLAIVDGCSVTTIARRPVVAKVQQPATSAGLLQTLANVGYPSTRASPMGLPGSKPVKNGLVRLDPAEP